MEMHYHLTMRDGESFLLPEETGKSNNANIRNVLTQAFTIARQTELYVVIDTSPIVRIIVDRSTNISNVAHTWRSHVARSYNALSIGNTTYENAYSHNQSTRERRLARTARFTPSNEEAWNRLKRTTSSLDNLKLIELTERWARHIEFIAKSSRATVEDAYAALYLADPLGEMTAAKQHREYVFDLMTAYTRFSYVCSLQFDVNPKR